ncbi:MAG TPA: geranylgeranyl reductase family protein [Pseudonocardiaceae bacterium]|jgi:geranylgeranyl reductase family protein|nr:geranylgeranyl reductase family protein [Pseudonocardiaceae bacterium]
MPSRRRADEDAEVIVVGAGPAGSTAATYLARCGLDVLLLEKSTFPREKVCGDGLTPRGVKQLIDLGVDTREEAGWLHNRGLRVVTEHHNLELDWPDLSNYPPYGLVRPRQDFDEMLARTAQRAGARLLEETNVNGAITDERTGRVVGVTAKVGKDKEPVSYRAPLVLACDGVSARLALSVGIEKRDDRPMGVAVRRYYTSSRTKDDYLESHLQLWDRSDPAKPVLLPGYGWIFGMGDGTVNVGLGILSTSKAYGTTDYRALMRQWVGGLPEDWEFNESTATGKIGGAALPMGFNRTPHYRDGLLLVGDAGGTVNPFNGEGIGFAMESAKIAAQYVVQALARPEGPARERALQGYPAAMKQALGSYYTLGNTFSKLIANPTIMRLATRHGLPKDRLMRLVLKLLAGLYDPRDGDAMDRIITVATKLAPSV